MSVKTEVIPSSLVMMAALSNSLANTALPLAAGTLQISAGG